ncbi:MAG: hypothetical protein QOF61_3119 [Acidobacteriota bacterium]|jgi:hypothetical protein|nr:hypothetical protein [Acidobacteriota bacterium]
MAENEDAPAGGQTNAEGAGGEAATAQAAAPQGETAPNGDAPTESAPTESVSTEEITYHAVEKDGEVSAIWEMQGRKHLRTIDPRSRQGQEILRLYTAENQ